MAKHNQPIEERTPYTPHLKAQRGKPHPWRNSCDVVLCTASRQVLLGPCFAKLPLLSNSPVKVARHVQPRPEGTGSDSTPMKHVKEMLLRKMRKNPCFGLHRKKENK
uniref:Uncharacterized protein n=1 Tax=Micrurus spixii TaxID=129469 RepID=A0A2D4LWZ8_9SAUR